MFHLGTSIQLLYLMPIMPRAAIHPVERGRDDLMTLMAQAQKSHQGKVAHKHPVTKDEASPIRACLRRQSVFHTEGEPTEGVTLPISLLSFFWFHPPQSSSLPSASGSKSGSSSSRSRSSMSWKRDSSTSTLFPADEEHREKGYGGHACYNTRLFQLITTHAYYYTAAGHARTVQVFWPFGFYIDTGQGRRTGKVQETHDWK